MLSLTFATSQLEFFNRRDVLPWHLYSHLMFALLYLFLASIESSDYLMTVFLKNTQEYMISVDLTPEASVQCIRNAIINDTVITRGIPHHQCNLRFGNKVLQNEQLLSDLGIGAQCCVEVECAVEELSELDDIIARRFPWGAATIERAVQKLRLLGRGAALARLSWPIALGCGSNQSWFWWIYKDDYETYRHYRFQPENGFDAWRYIKEVPQHRIVHVEPMNEESYIPYLTAKNLQSIFDWLVLLCLIVSWLVMMQMR